MTEKSSANFLARPVATLLATVAFIVFGGAMTTLSGCGGDAGSGDANFSQKFEKPATAPGKEAATKEAAPVAGNPDGQTPKARRAQDRAEDSKRR